MVPKAWKIPRELLIFGPQQKLGNAHSDIVKNQEEQSRKSALQYEGMPREPNLPSAMPSLKLCCYQKGAMHRWEESSHKNNQDHSLVEVSYSGDINL